MHRSSDSIATIAAALAKAQVGLTNPEKSIVATIRSPFPREADRTFRYAPLSSGLDIVRKSLDQHGIATIQATEIDKEAGLLRLTTVLAHASGEWISSDWPVCQISDMGSSQRVGAALTYARRYALFALVGITGEDDLDVPDLNANPNGISLFPRSSDPRKQGNGQAAAEQPTTARTGRPSSSLRTVLETQLSASLRESLIEQLVTINSADEAAVWAYRNLPAKNTLTAADAKIVEDQFRARVSAFSDSLDAEEPAKLRAVDTGVGAGNKGARRAKKQPHQDMVQTLGKLVRLRDKDHRKFVLRQPCLVCGRVPSDAHHLTFTQPRALGCRVSDEFTVPICRVHHRELHRSGDEAAWWGRLNIDPVTVALKLWQQTRSNTEALPAPRAPAAYRPPRLAHDKTPASEDSDSAGPSPGN
jgi:ERF superfamily